MKEQEQIAADLASKEDPTSVKGLRELLPDEGNNALDQD
jgi:hypothetical protein